MTNGRSIDLDSGEEMSFIQIEMDLSADMKMNKASLDSLPLDEDGHFSESDISSIIDNSELDSLQPTTFISEMSYQDGVEDFIKAANSLGERINSVEDNPKLDSITQRYTLISEIGEVVDAFVKTGMIPHATAEIKKCKSHMDDIADMKIEKELKILFDLEKRLPNVLKNKTIEVIYTYILDHPLLRHRKDILLTEKEELDFKEEEKRISELISKGVNNPESFSEIASLIDQLPENSQSALLNKLKNAVRGGILFEESVMLNQSSKP